MSAVLGAVPFAQYGSLHTQRTVAELNSSESAAHVRTPQKVGEIVENPPLGVYLAAKPREGRAAKYARVCE